MHASLHSHLEHDIKRPGRFLLSSSIWNRNCKSMAQSGALLQTNGYLECLKLVKGTELCRGRRDFLEVEAYVYGRGLSEWFEVYTTCTPKDFMSIVNVFLRDWRDRKHDSGLYRPFCVDSFRSAHGRNPSRQSLQAEFRRRCEEAAEVLG
jgi:hypothetical protein